MRVHFMIDRKVPTVPEVANAARSREGPEAEAPEPSLNSLRLRHALPIQSVAYNNLCLGQAQREVLVERVEELFGGFPLLVRSDEKSEVLRHVTVFNTLDDNVFEG